MIKINILVTLSKIMAFAVFGWAVYSGKVIEALPYIIILVTGKQVTDWLKEKDHETKAP